MLHTDVPERLQIILGDLEEARRRRGFADAQVQWKRVRPLYVAGLVVPARDRERVRELADELETIKHRRGLVDGKVVCRPNREGKYAVALLMAPHYFETSGRGQYRDREMKRLARERR